MKTTALSLFLLLIPALAPAATKSTGATKPPADLVAAANAAIDTGSLTALQADMTQRCTAALANPTTADPATLARLSTFREFARYFGQSPALVKQEALTLHWLVAQPTLLPVLMSAVSSHDPPDRVLMIIRTLGASQGQALDGMADLATALAVVLDKPLSAGVNPAAQVQRVPRLFAYFANSRATNRFDPAALPWELSVYMVDVKISEDEMQWAVQKYAHFNPVAQTFFDVPYDTPAYTKGDPKEITKHDYTLPNLLQYGGVCIDQAYYASQVAKSLGAPSCICTGQGGVGGIAHAWVGCLESATGRTVWNFDEGRYKEYLYWSADISDPQTQQKLNDGQVGLLAETFSTPFDARVESALMIKLADIAPPVAQFDLYTRAIELSHGNLNAWMHLADLGQQGKLLPAQLDTVGAAVRSYAVVSYPEFAYDMLVKLAGARHGDERLAALADISTLFPMRPDLRSRALIQQGELFQRMNHDPQALADYGDVLTNDLDAGPVVEDALHHVDKMLHTENDLNRLAQVYAQVWPKMTAPDPSAYAADTPYADVGKAYADLLEEMGNKPAADDVRDRINKLVEKPTIAQ